MSLISFFWCYTCTHARDILMRFNGIQNYVAHLADQIILSGGVKLVYIYIYLFFDMGLKAHTQTLIFGGLAVESADSNAKAAESADSIADSPVGI